MKEHEFRQPKHIELEDGDIVIVPLGRQGSKHAFIDKADYDYLMKLGLSTAWHESAGGYVAAVAHRARGNLINVARVLLNAGIGQYVRYVDGDPRNLRRSNLKLLKGGWAIRRDRAYLTPPERQRKNRRLAHAD